ncbi:metallophosphoesterase [Xanthomonas arboricola pv. corylina]|nr:metallophosphoesterase [Xanthomonas arboricola pv. corylina]
MVSRRKFLFISAGLVLAGCEESKLGLGGPKSLRICVASDLHFGQPDTPYEDFANDFIKTVNNFSKNRRVDFLVFNGDLIHDDSKYIVPVRDKLNELSMRYFVTKGNHDAVEESLWKKCFGTYFNHELVVGDDVFLFANTSDFAGTYLCPDVAWLKSHLDKHKNARNILVFMHINPAGETKFAVECEEILNLLASHRNVRAVFNGHDHDHDEVIQQKEFRSYLTDMWGSWGVGYRGFRIIEINGEDKILTYMMNGDSVINSSLV